MMVTVYLLNDNTVEMKSLDTSSGFTSLTTLSNEELVNLLHRTNTQLTHYDIEEDGSILVYLENLDTPGEVITYAFMPVKPNWSELSVLSDSHMEDYVWGIFGYNDTEIRM